MEGNNIVRSRSEDQGSTASDCTACKPCIGVWPPNARTANKVLLEALSDALPLRFADCHLAGIGEYAAVIDFASDARISQTCLEQGRDCFVFEATAGDGALATEFDVEFTSSSALPAALRGRQFRHESLSDGAVLNETVGEEVLAQCGGKPAWGVCQSGNSCHHRAAIPVNLPTGLLVHQFRRMNFMRLLPLFCFLRAVCVKAGWQFPATRACLMLDDPNLHWWTYGCVDYRQLLQHAQKHEYHISMATIPIDQRWAHGGVVRLFLNHGRHLSLLIHGVRHTFGELVSPGTEKEALELLAQGLRLIQRMEARTGLKVARTVAPPHGKCNLLSLAAMARLGIEACANSWGSITGNVPLKDLPASLAMSGASFLGGGCAVLDRFRMARNRDFEIVRACLLDQPIIPVGHHTDLKGGLELVSLTAGRIAALGPVKWLDMIALVRSNYASMEREETLWVLMHSRHIEIALPPNAVRLALLRPWLRDGESEPLSVQVANESIQLDGGKVAIVDLPRENKGEMITVASTHRMAIDPAVLPPLHAAIWPVIRRTLSEGRDRLYGSFDRLKR
jgi:hypothetical protein